jgi:hypothetical protein
MLGQPASPVEQGDPLEKLLDGIGAGPLPSTARDQASRDFVAGGEGRDGEDPGASGGAESADYKGSPHYPGARAR